MHTFVDHNFLKENEFVIGNLNGDLAIFKGQCEDGFPSYVCRGLGTVSFIYRSYIE